MESWSEEDVLKLINCYEGNPCLYDLNLKEYRNRNKKRAHKNEIAEQLKRSSTHLCIIQECTRTFLHLFLRRFPITSVLPLCSGDYTKTAHRQNSPDQNGPKNFNA